MMSTAETSGFDRIARLIEIAPVGVDDFSALRYLYAKSLIAQTAAAAATQSHRGQAVSNARMAAYSVSR